jgi:hypothetical protein
MEEKKSEVHHETPLPARPALRRLMPREAEAATVLLSACSVEASRERREGGMRTKEDQRRDARIEALEEAANHLEQNWTEDSLERSEGKKVSAELREKIRELYEGER